MVGLTGQENFCLLEWLKRYLFEVNCRKFCRYKRRDLDKNESKRLKKTDVFLEHLHIAGAIENHANKHQVLL